MVHALERIHRSLRDEGVLLDVHPQPRNIRVEVWQDGRIASLGELDLEEDSRVTRLARARLRAVERGGFFVTERRRFFDLLAHFPTVEDWFEWRAQERATSVVPEELLRTARHLVATGGELVTREPIRASLLRRLPAPAGWANPQLSEGGRVVGSPASRSHGR